MGERDLRMQIYIYIYIFVCSEILCVRGRGRRGRGDLWCSVNVWVCIYSTHRVFCDESCKSRGTLFMSLLLLLLL